MKTFKDHINEEQGPCWDGYKQVGMKKKGNKMVPNCVPVGEARFFTDEDRDKYVSDEIKRRKLARFVVNDTENYRMRKGKPTFTFPSPSGDMVIRVWLRKMTPSKNQPSGIRAFNYDIVDK